MRERVVLGEGETIRQAERRRIAREEHKRLLKYELDDIIREERERIASLERQKLENKWQSGLRQLQRERDNAKKRLRKEQKQLKDLQKETKLLSSNLAALRGMWVGVSLPPVLFPQNHRHNHFYLRSRVCPLMTPRPFPSLLF